MDPSFRQWLATTHNAPPKLLKKLEKEDILNRATLSALTDSDLETLQRKHKLPMGHVIVLRSGRDELRGAGKSGRSPRRDLDDFEVLAAPVERDGVQASAAVPSYPPRLEDLGENRPTGDAIRSKYQLPVRSRRHAGRDAPAAPRNGARAVPSATPSPLPDHAPTPTPAGGAGLTTAAQMRDLHRRGVERGEKIAVIEQKSRGLESTAMDYETICAQLADKQRHGKKKKKKKKEKKKDEASVPQEALPQDKKTSSSPPSPARQRLSASTPPTLPTHTRHSSQSPSRTPGTSHTLPSSPPPQGPHSDPIRHRSPHVVPSYGTIDRDQSRPTTPTSFTYTSDDEKLHLHYDEETGGNQTANDRGSGKCPCCRTM